MDGNYLDLFKWDFKAKGLVVVRVERVLLDCRLLLLQPLTILHQVDLHIWICRANCNIISYELTCFSSIGSPLTDQTEHAVIVCHHSNKTKS